MYKLILSVISCLVAGSLYAAQPGTSLLDVYQLAVRNSPQLAAAHASYQAQAESIPLARAGLLPQLGLAANYHDAHNSVDTRDGSSTSNNRYSHSLQATLSQPLFRLDSWYQLKAAKEQNEQALLELSASEQNLILHSAQAYFALLRAEDELAANQAEERAMARQLELVSARFDVGMADNTDVLQARAAHDTAAANLLHSQNLVADAWQGLASLTNTRIERLYGLSHQMPVQPPSPADAEQWVNSASNDNLQLQASQLAVSAAGYQLQQRKSGHAPTLDAIAQYQRADSASLGFIPQPGQPGYRRHAEQTLIGIQLNIPLYSGGATSAAVRQSRHNVDQLEFNYEQLRRQVVQDAHNLFRAVNTDVARIQARLQALRSSQSVLEATAKGYDIGTRTMTDVLDAERQLYAAVRQYNNARYDYLLNNLQLQLVAGSLSPQHLQAINSYLDPHYRSETDFLPAP